MTRRRGIAAVEFALGATFLFAVMAGTFEIGYALVQYGKLQGAVAQAARFAAVAPYDSTTSTPSAPFLASVRNMAVFGNPKGGTAPLVKGLTTGNIKLFVTLTNGVPAAMKVSVSGYSLNALFASFSLNGKPQAIFPYQGMWAPQ